MTATDNATLAPTNIDVVIGERLFVQKPLSLRGTARLVNVLSVEIAKAANNPALAVLMASEASEMNAITLVPSLVQALAGIPDALPRIIGTILGVDVDKDEATIEYINDECSPAKAMSILRSFVEQNEPEELIANFTVLRGTFSKALNKSKE